MAWEEPPVDATTSWKVFPCRWSTNSQASGKVGTSFRPPEPTHLSVRPVSAPAGPRGSHLLPGDHQGAHRLCLRAPRKRSLHVLASSPQSLRTAVLPEVDGAPPVAVVQVSQQGGDHHESGGHLAQVLALRRRLLEGHEPVGVDLEGKPVRRVLRGSCEELVVTTATVAGQEVLTGWCFGGRAAGNAASV